MPLPYDFTLPAQHTCLRLQDLSRAEQQRLLPQVFALVRAQYPEWPAESVHHWCEALAGGHAFGTQMAVSVVLDAQGQVVATSALELYTNGTAMINYSLAHPDSAHPAALLYAATQDMAQAIKAMQAAGACIHFVGKEHHLKSLRAIAGYYAVGQVPIDGPTSLLTAPVKYFEVAYGDPKDLENPSQRAHAMRLADPKRGYREDENVHLWLLGDFTPSVPDRPLAPVLKALADAYAREHSIFRGLDIRLDPGYQSLHQMAALLPASATYQQAVQASSIGAAQWLGLD